MYSPHIRIREEVQGTEANPARKAQNVEVRSQKTPSTKPQLMINKPSLPEAQNVQTPRASMCWFLVKDFTVNSFRKDRSDPYCGKSNSDPQQKPTQVLRLGELCSATLHLPEREDACKP